MQITKGPSIRLIVTARRIFKSLFWKVEKFGIFAFVAILRDILPVYVNLQDTLKEPSGFRDCNFGKLMNGAESPISIFFT